MFSDAFLKLARQRRVSRPLIDDGKRRIFCLQTGTFGTNAYVVIDVASGRRLLIDAPGDAAYLISRLPQADYVLLTHGHFDHTGALEEIMGKLEARLAAHAGDAYRLPLKPDIYLEGGETLELGATRLSVLHTPGHSPGSLCFMVGNCLFSGDTIFPGGPGYTGRPQDFQTIVKSISSKILTLPPTVIIYPGHGEAISVGEAAAEYSVFAARPHAPDICGEVSWADS